MWRRFETLKKKIFMLSLVLNSGQELTEDGKSCRGIARKWGKKEFEKANQIF